MSKYNNYKFYYSSEPYCSQLTQKEKICMMLESWEQISFSSTSIPHSKYIYADIWITVTQYGYIVWNTDPIMTKKSFLYFNSKQKAISVLLF